MCNFFCVRLPPTVRSAAPGATVLLLMKDRLADLRGGSGLGLGNGGGADLEAGGAAPPGTSAFMQAFFDDVQEIKKSMSSIRYNIRQIEQNHGECLTAISADQGRASTERLDELMKSERRDRSNP